MASEYDVYKKLHSLRELPYGSARVRAAEELSRIVEKQGPESLLAVVLLNQVEAYDFSGEGKKSYVVFAKLLRLYDTRPEIFDEHDTHALFWQFKWVADSLGSYPEITKKQANAFLDDMQRRFTLAAKGLAAPRVSRFQYSVSTGAEDAEALRLEWLATPEDDFNDCPACVVGSQVDYFVSRQMWSEAVAMGRTQADSCNVEPAGTHHLMALAELMVGNSAAALQHINDAAATLDSSFSSNGFVAVRGTLYEALGRGGAKDEFLRLLRTRDMQELNSDGTSLGQLRFNLGVLAGVSALLHQDSANGDTATGFTQHLPQTLNALRDFLSAQTAPIAERFDSRNENSFYTDWLERAKNASAASKPLPKITSFAQKLAKLWETTEISDTQNTADSQPQTRDDYTAAQDADLDAQSRYFAKQQILLDPDSYPALEVADVYLDEAHKLYAAVSKQIKNLASMDTWAGKIAENYLEKLSTAGLFMAEAAAVLGRDKQHSDASKVFAKAADMLQKSGQLPSAAMHNLLIAWGPVAEKAEDLKTVFDFAKRRLKAVGALTTTNNDEHAHSEQQIAVAKVMLLRCAAAIAEPSITELTTSNIISELQQILGKNILEAEDTAHTLWLLGRINAAGEDYENALQVFIQARKIFLDLNKTKPAQQLKHEILRCYHETGQYALADTLLESF